ncbi:MAG: response regulator transcription factor [Chitinophagaceae bacterium]|nr:response regulator transcription factor [Chitinophagaceae bacterium]
MIKALIIDDEKKNTDNLAILLRKYCENIGPVSIAHTASEAREYITSHPPDLIFLDIQMPGEDGFEFLRSLSDILFEVIFVTAHDTYGIQAAKFSAIDYLLKPIIIDELTEAVRKAAKRIAQKKENTSLKNLLHYLKNNNSAEVKLALPLLHETRLIPVKNIIRAESKNVYTYFFVEKGEKIVVSKPLRFYEELLSEYGFIRTHQSHLINRSHVISLLSKDGICIVMSDNSQIPVSRQRKDEVRKILLHTP